MSTQEPALVHIEDYQSSIVPAAAIASRQNAIWTLMAKSMEKGTDYGLTPGCKGKNSLFKPGAEKILAMFMLSVDPLVEDLCPATDDPYSEFRVRVHVTLKDGNGRFAGKGVGECSSWEEKYKWRRAVNHAEFEYMDKQGLARLKFGQDWSTKKDYQLEQVRVPTADIANTIVKMGKKRGQIDATLTATAASAIFTQDLEDMPEEIAAEISSEGQEEVQQQKVRKPQRKGAAEAKPEAPKEPAKPRDPECITENQQKYLYVVSTKCKLSHDEVKAKLQAEFKGKDGQPLKSSGDMLRADFQKYLDSVDPKFQHHEAPNPDGSF